MVNDQYCVLLDLTSPLPVTQATAVIATLNKIPAFDAARAVRNGWGFLLENGTEESARNLVEGLKAANVGSKMFKHCDLAALPDPYDCNKAALGTQGFSYFSSSSPDPVITPWKNVFLIAAGVFQKEIITTHIEEKGPSIKEKAARMGLMAIGLPVGFGKKEKVEVERKETTLYFLLDVFLSNPSVRMRINPQSFNFNCLKENMTYSSTTNFRVLITELLQRAPASFKNQGTEFIVGGKPLNQLHYESIADLEKESRWILSLSNYGK